MEHSRKALDRVQVGSQDYLRDILEDVLSITIILVKAAARSATYETAEYPPSLSPNYN